ncbi:hypothetical protein [Helicobacter marmotae]|uniref:hypothetical protein n=1 Tax=Helicobacter marmotae TaxID=152490 RepID=UPI0011C02AC8|nr:hypothetical protein [Helicobacter marmotae]
MQGKLVCHSEGAQGATEESLPESLVASRDSSLDSQAQNDNLRESLIYKRDSSVISLPQNDNSGRVDGESNRDSSGLKP